MHQIGIVLIALGVGLAAGFVLAVRQRAAGRARVTREREGVLATGALEARIEAQSAEIRRLADGSRVRDAGDELEALEASADEPERHEALARDVERVVAARAREVAQYLDPGLTAPVAVAAVPDAAYAVLRRAHAEAFGRGVVIVPYSSAL